MPRYVTGWECDTDHYWNKGPLLPALHADGDRQPIDTGLLDARGRRLHRLPEPVGFHSPGGRRGD